MQTLNTSCSCNHFFLSRRPQWQTLFEDVDDLRRAAAAAAFTLSAVACCTVDCVRRHFFGAAAATAEVMDVLCSDNVEDGELECRPIPPSLLHILSIYRAT